MDDLRGDKAPGVDEPIPETEEILGGDPVCWAHLFDDQLDAVAQTDKVPACEDRVVIDAAEIAREARRSGPARSRRSEDLDINVLVFVAGEGIAEHVNDAVDVLLVAVSGEGMVRLDGESITLRSGQLALIPKGTRRSIQALSDQFVYVSCHRRRPGLMPVLRHE